jgi:hypothetical protein
MGYGGASGVSASVTLAFHVWFKCSRPSFSIKTCVENFPYPFECAKDPESEKYGEHGFLPCRVIIQIKGIF